jgi:tight adherence protein B
MTTQLLVAILMGIGIFMVFVSFALKRSSASYVTPKWYEQKAMIKMQEMEGVLPEIYPPGIRGVLQRLGSRAEKPSRSQKVQESLSKANINMRVGEWYGFRMVFPVGMFLLLFLINKNLIVSIVLGVLSYFLPGLFVRFRRGQRKSALGKQLPNTMASMTNALHGGQSVLQAIDSVISTMPDPISAEFIRIKRDMELGLQLGEALKRVADRLESRDFQMMVIAVQIQQKTGGSLADILEVITGTMRERIKLQGTVKSLTAQAQASGYIILGLPFALTGILVGIAPSYMLPMFSNVLGYAFIGLAGVMMTIGFFLIKKITSIEI